MGVQQMVGCCRNEDLFKQLESRELTEEELGIIQSRVRVFSASLQRFAVVPECNESTARSDRFEDVVTQVALQRKMLQEYEKRERSRKVSAISAQPIEHNIRLVCVLTPCIGSCAPPMIPPTVNLCIAVQIQEIQSICPDVTEEEALKALDLCNQR